MKEAEEAKEVEKKKAKEVSKQPTIKETLERGIKVDPKSDLRFLRSLEGKSELRR